MTTSIEVKQDPTELVPIREERTTLVSRVLQFVITTDEQRIELTNLVLALKAIRKKIEAHYKPLKQAIDTAKKTVLAQEKADLDPVERAERMGGAQIIVWNTEQEKKRLAEIARREAEAREKAEAEKAQRVAELRKQTDALKKSGDDETAAALRQQATALKKTDVIAEYEAPPEPEKVSGTSTVKLWRAVCFDKLALVKAIAIGAIPLDAVDVNETWLRKKAEADKEDFNVPGCKATSTDSFRGRTS